MPALTVEHLHMLRDDYRKYPNFIETGTYRGETIMQMEPLFTRLYTVEIKPEFHRAAQGAYAGSKIEFRLGDSSVELERIVRGVVGSSVIFLDGHWSAGDTGRGEKDCPLYEELGAIVTHHAGAAIVVIDDVRLFGKGPSFGNEVCDWESISEDRVLALVSGRLVEKYHIPSYLDARDRLVLHLAAIPATA
jgi:hypothetical protein